ncbi:hypothetical protein AMATHDRAFT_2267 [Amanita thiersii Skay4041]|uniref:Alkaline ceramidase n=1 Tax=Amanita thiersii Skay4041 TaxID=703135 RepID=A0A2A9NVD5_9AGAR|nr:hypothetical protein AMATHDRAFT_2267 [Amanita thiersii Skay4041]
MAMMNSSWIQNQGFFGPVTATLDWCEANYQFSYYIAEMMNTFSNLFTIALSVFGYLEACRQSLPQRYLAGYVGVGLVGFGSFAFHATLLYEAQLADELPMIYVGSMGVWLLFDNQPGFNLHNARTKWLIFLLVTFDFIFSLSYYFYRNPVYHQIVFASIVLLVTFRITYVLNFSEASSRIPPKTKSLIGKLFSTGAGLFAFGFFIWNMDNIFCINLTNLKRTLGWPIAFLLEGHSWWHIFTGAGSYYMFIGIQCMSYLYWQKQLLRILADVTLCLKDAPEEYTIGYKYYLPRVIRVPSKKH